MYGPQAKRHVAEQVDRLYFNAAERGVEILGVGEEWGDRGVDYRQFSPATCLHYKNVMLMECFNQTGEDSIIEQLPEEWSEEAKEKVPEQAQRYKDLQQKLVGLNERRRVARERLESSKRVMGLLNPFDKEGGLQGNLVVKNGEMEEELERMRRLMLRYERARDGAGEGSRSGEDGDTDVDMEGAEEKKIMTLLSAT